MNKSESITKLAGALVKAQAEMPVIKMDAKNPFLKYKYATLGAVINACRPILAKHEFGVVQLPVSDGDRVGVETMLIHSSGEWIGDVCFLSSEEQKGLSQAQVAGVSITYLRRYSLASLLGLYADEDTDASEDHENGERPPQQLERRPTPETKTPAPVTERQKLKADFSAKFRQASQLGVKTASIKADATDEEIKAAIEVLDKKIAEAAAVPS